MLEELPWARQALIRARVSSCAAMVATSEQNLSSCAIVCCVSPLQSLRLGPYNRGMFQVSAVAQ